VRGLLIIRFSFALYCVKLIPVVGTNIKPEELMDSIRHELMSGKHLPLYSERIKNGTLPVPGEGNLSAKIMIIGEAPGKNEAATGRPFCGRSGQILDELLSSAGINRADVFITNIVKDRPPGNRDPLPDEIEAYAPYLDRQIDIIKPKVISTLGRFSMKYIMNKFGAGNMLDSIGKIHGKIFNAKASYGDVFIIPLYHPAASIYNGTIDVLKKDFKIIRQFK